MTQQQQTAGASMPSVRILAVSAVALSLPPSSPSSWHSLVLLRGLAMLFLTSTTAYVTRSAATAKVLGHLGNTLATALRVLLQVAFCADLLLSASHSTATGPAVAGAAAGACRTSCAVPGSAGPQAAAGAASMPWQLTSSPAHLVVGTFLLNQLVLFTTHHVGHSEVAWGLVELVPLCANLWLLHSGSGGTGSGNPSSLPRLLVLAVMSRVLLPLLASHLPPLVWPNLRCTSTNSNSNSANSRSSRSSPGAQAMLHAQ